MMSEAQAASILARWISEIESVQASGWSRKCHVIGSKYPDFADPAFRVSIELSPLRLGEGEEMLEDDDFSGKRHSRWSFALSELWREKVSSYGEECQSSPNWTRIWNSWIEFEYRQWAVYIVADGDRLVSAERNLKLGGLGI